MDNKILYQFFLDMQDDQDIVKNFTLVLEKLLVCIVISLIGATNSVQLIFQSPSSNHVFWTICLIFSISIGFQYSQAVFILTKTEKSVKLINFILVSQCIGFSFHTFIIQEYTYTVIQSPDTNQLQLTNLVIIISFFNTLYICNQPKIFTISLTEIFLIYQTIYSSEQQIFKYLLWIHAQLICFFTFTLIQQLVINQAIRENQERMEIYSSTMHDLRNQIYSLADINQQIAESNSFDDVIIEDVFQDVKIKQYTNQEKDNILKFIENKICFLYHIELIFDRNYSIKNNYIDCKKMIEQTEEKLKAIFLYKNSNINIRLKSHIITINLDFSIFEYLLILLTRSLHEYGCGNIDIIIIINPVQNQTILTIEFKIENLNPAIKNRLYSKEIYSKLICSLKQNTKFKLQFGNNSILFQIMIPKNNNHSIQCTNDIDFPFYVIPTQTPEISTLKPSSTLVQDFLINIKQKDEQRFTAEDYSHFDGINLTFNDSIIIDNPKLDINHVDYKFDGNQLFLNVDDEDSILRMNKRAFAKEKLHLNCCLDRFDLLNLLGKLHSDIHNKVMSRDINVLAIIDHLVDCDYGQKIVDNAMAMNELWDLNIKFILLSSTEGKDTIRHYEKLGMTEFITKPLTNLKLNDLLDKVYNQMIF